MLYMYILYIQYIDAHIAWFRFLRGKSWFVLCQKLCSQTLFFTKYPARNKSRIIIYKGFTANHVRVKYRQSFIRLFPVSFPREQTILIVTIFSKRLFRARHTQCFFFFPLIRVTPTTIFLTNSTAGCNLWGTRTSQKGIEQLL